MVVDFQSVLALYPARRNPGGCLCCASPMTRRLWYAATQIVPHRWRGYALGSAQTKSDNFLTIPECMVMVASLPRYVVIPSLTFTFFSNSCFFLYLKTACLFHTITNVSNGFFFSRFFTDTVFCELSLYCLGGPFLSWNDRRECRWGQYTLQFWDITAGFLLGQMCAYSRVKFLLSWIMEPILSTSSLR